MKKMRKQRNAAEQSTLRAAAAALELCCAVPGCDSGRQPPCNFQYFCCPKCEAR
eukprot:SAG31_NODE_15907_length_731_cov_1.401264_1_plen_53_part_10